MSASERCPACEWQGSWDGEVCPECGAATIPIEWTFCRLKAYSGDDAGVVVLESECRCGQHGPGDYVFVAAKFLEKGLKAGDEFWIVANLDGVQGQVLTVDEGARRGRVRPFCKSCGATCGPAKGCDLDQGHVHLPGGLRTYGLCLPCEKECVRVHHREGRWVNEGCGDAACGYCKALFAELTLIYGEWPRR